MPKKNTKFVWTDELETHFQSIKNKDASATEKTHYNPQLETRMKCDASRAGLGAALERPSPTGWHTVAFASRFLKSNEERYSINELELLGVVWSVEYFKYYLFGKSFTIITDHRALLSIMKEHWSNKSNNSRLILWLDRLLHFDFHFEHIPGAKMGLVDYLSRQPNQGAKDTNKYDEEFVVATITRIRDAIAAIYVNTTQQNCQSQHFCSVNHTHSTRASHPHSTNYSNLLSAINRNTSQLLLDNTAIAAKIHSKSNLKTNATQINSNSNPILSSPKSNPETPPTHSRVTFQSTPNLAVSSTHSSNDGQTSPNLEQSKEEIFENNLTQLFTKWFLAVPTSKDAVFRSERLHSTKRRPKMHGGESLSLFLLEGLACWVRLCLRRRTCGNTTFNLGRRTKILHLTHLVGWGMITLKQYAFWPYMQRENLNKAAQC